MKESAPKFIFITGGVISSLGKGILSASLGTLLQSRGISVSLMKLDPYINVDPGTMNPFQHGEVFVTDDGAETDLDLGHYERFTGMRATRVGNITSGQIYDAVIRRERKGGYLGQTVQVIPHVTDEIKSRIRYAASATRADVMISEIGGTVGDIESLPFLEAIRQMRRDMGYGNVLYLHLTLVPYQESAGELKTKPTQHSVAALREIGIRPNMLFARSDRALSEEVAAKISLFSDLPREAVVSVPDCDTIYRVPLLLAEAGADEIILSALGIEAGERDLSGWEKFVRAVSGPSRTVEIAIVGKYTHLADAYKSISEALIHAGASLDTGVRTTWIDSDEAAADPRLLDSADGIIVPGGFGERGIEGMIDVVGRAREGGIPFLGICLGLQCAVIEFARRVVGLTGAGSAEFDPGAEHPVIALMSSQEGVNGKGGTMRLGAWPCRIREGTLAARLYGSRETSERHRHRYEVNNAFRDRLAEGGLVLSGLSPDGLLIEMVEIPSHPFFIASQFHPEFRSRPNLPHPLFRGLIEAALSRRGD